MGEPNAEELKRFYDERSKITKYDRFRYDEQGNLTEYNTKGALIKTIVLPTYRPPTEDERIQMEQERKDAIITANRTLEDARTRLYSAIQSNASKQEILDENDKVREADIILQNIRFPLRQTTMETGIKIRDIYFDQVQETRVFPYPIAFSHVRPFTLQQQYVRVGDISLPQMVSVAEAKEEVEEKVILFSDQDMETRPYGFLALGWPVAIVIKDKTYRSARHAIFAELAMEFNDTERAAAIEASDGDIHYSVDDVAGGREVNQAQWNKKMVYLINLVNTIKFKNYPELAQRLVETGRAIIGAYEPNDLQIGIGLSMENVKAKDKLSWTGENLLGKALMKIRDLIVAERTAQLVKPPRKPRSAISAAPSVAPSAAPIAAPSAAPVVAPSAAPVVAPSVAPIAALSVAPVVAPIAPSVAPIAPSVAPPTVPSIRRGPRVAPIGAASRQGKVYLGTKTREAGVGWSPKPYEGIKLVDVTSSQSAASTRRRNFSPMTEIEGGYKGFYNFEHYWQSGKVFKGIPEEVTKQWWKQQQTPARRYPGAKGLTVLYSSWPDETPYHAANEHMDWVTSRKKVYVPEYAELVKNRPSTVELQQWINAGNDLILYDYDGPKEEGRPITLEVTPDMLRSKINDVRAPFGHGYVVGALVKGIPLEAYSLA